MSLKQKDTFVHEKAVGVQSFFNFISLHAGKDIQTLNEQLTWVLVVE